MRALLAHALRHWRSYFWGFVALACVDFINSNVQPLLLGLPFKKLEKDASPESFFYVGLAFVGVSLVQVVLRYFWRYFFMGTSERIGLEIREALFQKLQRLPIGFFDKAKTGDLMSRATNDMDSVRTALGMGALLAFDSVCYFVMVPALMFWISWKLTLVTLCFVPVVPVLIYTLGQTVHKRSRIVQDVFGVLSARLQETFSGIRVVQAFAQEEREAERFGKVATDYLESSRSLARIQSAFNPAIEAVFDIALVVVLYFGGRLVVDEDLPLDKLVTFARALDQIVWPMAAVGWLTSILQRGAAAHQRIEEVLKEAEDPTFKTRETVPAEPAVDGAIAARSLTFRYPTAAPEREPALAEVTFEAPSGALVAIVGPVGSGKSTLLSLVARLYDPPAGGLFVDGRDILDVPIARLRRGVALVPQESFLFSATIEENVKLGRSSELGRAQVIEAARAAQVESEIERLPGGFDALLGERGVNLSGGQRQRVAIARALVRRPRILLLDDALSAVDTQTESALFSEIQRASSDGRPPTRLVATHRLAIARAADLVLVLEKGRVVERGRHADLLAADGLYARLARRDALEEALTRVS